MKRLIFLLFFFCLVFHNTAYCGEIYEELSMEGNKITSVDDPVNPQDAATKAYVDANDISLPLDHTNSGEISGVGTNTHVVVDGHIASTSNPHSTSDVNLSITDVTNNDVTSVAHGFTPKLPEDATLYLDGTGNYTAPPGSATNPGGSANQMQFNDGGSSFGGADWIYSDTDKSLTGDGDVEITKVDPEIKLTDSGDSPNNTRLTRTDTSSAADRFNTVITPAGANNAVDFDGTDDYINIPIRDSCSAGQTKMTMSLWAYPHTLDSTDRFLFVETVNGSTVKGRIALYIDTNNKFAVGGRSPGNTIQGFSQYVASTVGLSTYTWYHVVGVYNSTTDIHKIYVDNVITTNTVVTVTWNNDTPGSVTIGNDASMFWFDGLIDEPVGWQRELTIDEVNDLYSAGNGIKVNKADVFPSTSTSQGTDLCALWHHDETAMNAAPSGTDTEDESVYTKHGVAQASMTDADFVSGKIQGTTSTEEITVWSSTDSGEVGVCGLQTYGDPDGRTTIEGKTIPFNIGGVEIGQIDAAGTLTLDNVSATAPGLIVKGTAGQTASLVQFTDSADAVYVDSGDGLTGSEFAGNEQGVDVDFRWETANQANTLLVDAANDEVKMGDGVTDYTGINSNGDVNYVGNGGLQFGQIYEEDGIGTLVIPAQDTYYQLTQFSANGESNGSVIPDHTNDHITIGAAGRYLVSASVSFSQTTAVSIEYDFHIKKNNGATDYPQVSIHRNSGGNSAVGNGGATGIIDFAANDTVELWVRRLDGGAVSRTITIRAMSLTLVQIGGTT